MIAFTVKQGFLNPPRGIEVQAPAEHGGYAAAAGSFDDAPDLACVIWPGDDRASVGVLACSWDDPEAAVVRIDFDQGVIDSLELGWHRAVVTVEATNQAIAEFRLNVEAGPGAAVARPVYCSHRDLTDELPWLGDLASETQDQTGFAEARAEAREWIDSVILASIPSPRGAGLRSYEWGWSWGDYRGLRGRYADALAAGGLDVASPSGRGFVRVAVQRSLATILRRCVGVEAGSGRDLPLRSAFYATTAESGIVRLIAEFPATNLRPVNLGFAPSRRR